MVFHAESLIGEEAYSTDPNLGVSMTPSVTTTDITSANCFRRWTTPLDVLGKVVISFILVLNTRILSPSTGKTRSARNEDSNSLQGFSREEVQVAQA
ncbi:hypothetical protein HS7_19000 [Sulfolobales archaeon HS-7]|nr:hypothetical protein HS7_19000 [Sulfolobales archaeon HS-7]